MESLTGIYQVRNLTTNQCYVGQSVNIRVRWQNHLSALRAGRHDNVYLQRSFDKYGEDVFEFSVITLCSEELLTDIEQWYLDAWQPAFNLTLVAGVPPRFSGEEHPLYGTTNPEHAARMRTDWNPMKDPEQRARMSGEGNPMFGVTGSAHPKSRRVAIIKDGVVHEVFESVTEAAAWCGGRHGNISRACSGKQKTAYGRVWRYLA